MTTAGLPVRKRFNMYVFPKKKGRCWLWRGTLDAHGYGALRVENKTVKAHRLAKQLSGVDVPDDLCVCHHCDNRRCVNPEHLFLGTRSDNLKDMWAKGRGKHPKGKRLPKS